MTLGEVYRNEMNLNIPPNNFACFVFVIGRVAKIFHTESFPSMAHVHVCSVSIKFTSSTSLRKNIQALLYRKSSFSLCGASIQRTLHYVQFHLSPLGRNMPLHTKDTTVFSTKLFVLWCCSGYGGASRPRRNRPV